MNPPPDLKPGVCYADEVAFRRGKWLTIVLVISTLVIFSGDTLCDFVTVGKTSTLVRSAPGFIMIGFVCWRVFLGGILARGCLMLFAVAAFLGLFLGAGELLMHDHPDPGFFGSIGNLRSFGSDGRSAISFLFVGLWGTFALWVLLISKDARRYQGVRRREIAGAERQAFEWPPAGRRQKP